MNNQIEERIIIAKKFKSIYNWDGKSPEKKERALKRVALLDSGIVMVLLSILIVASAMSTFQIEYISKNWTNTGLLVLMTMALSLRAPLSFIELMLHRHIDQIQKLEIEFDKNINTEFDDIVEGFNKRKKYIYLMGIPVIVISISAILQVFNANPYWDKFPPIVLFVSSYIVSRIIYNILRIKINFAKLATAV